MKPEYTGNEDASTFLGALNCAVMVCDSPGRRRTKSSERETCAYCLVSGTGPSDGKIVPCKFNQQRVEKEMRKSSHVLDGLSSSSRRVSQPVCLRVEVIVRNGKLVPKQK